MKKTFSLLLSLLSFVSLGDDLGPMTELNDVPGTATLREMFKAGGGDGSATTNDLQDATNLLDRIKRDKDDLAVYEVVHTENTDWTWTSENKEFAHDLNEAGTKPEWNGHAWWYVNLPSNYSINMPVETGQSVTSITYNVSKIEEIPVVARCTATRLRYMDETLGPAKADQQLVAVATDDASKPANGDLVKYDAANDRLVKAVAETDYLKEHQDISGKRDLTDNTCHKTEYAWDFSEQKEARAGNYSVLLYEVPLAGFAYKLLDGGVEQCSSADAYPSIEAADAVDAVTWSFGPHPFGGTKTYKTDVKICTDGKKFVTEDVAATEVAKEVERAKAAESQNAAAEAAKSAIDEHVSDTNNPHGVTAEQVNSYMKSETDAKLAGKLDKTGGTVSGNFKVQLPDYGGTILSVERGLVKIADGQTYFMGSGGQLIFSREGFEDIQTIDEHGNVVTLKDFLDSLDWRTTGNRTLADYGITDAATKTELAGYLPLSGGTMSGTINMSGKNIYTDGGIIAVGDGYLNVYGAGRVWFESASLVSIGDYALPAYLSSGDWNTASDPFAKVSQIPVISATDQTFSDAVLAVGLNIDTNSVAVLNDIAKTFGGFPLGAGETATTVGGLLAALAAAIAWLKKNALVGGLTGGVPDDPKVHDFFTESNSLLTGTIDAEVISKGTAPDAHLEAPTDEHLKLILADNSVAYDSAKALPYKLTSVIGDRVIATMTLNAASTDITLPAIAANDTTVKDFILDVTNAYAVEGVATDAGINIPRTDFKLVTRDGESLTDVTTVKAGKSAFICFTQKSPVVVDGTTYPCWCVIQLPFGDPS